MQNIKSKYGEGIGGAVQSPIEDPNHPSYDPAEKITSTDKKIRALLHESKISLLTEWERNFLCEIYGAGLTRKQAITISKIYRKYIEPTPPHPSLPLISEKRL